MNKRYCSTSIQDGDGVDAFNFQGNLDALFYESRGLCRCQCERVHILYQREVLNCEIRLEGFQIWREEEAKSTRAKVGEQLFGHALA